MERAGQISNECRVADRLNQSKLPVDVIYVTASKHDARYTRICVASIRFFYPTIPVNLLLGGEVERGLQKELAEHWDVGCSRVPKKDWGWGFVKLEPLFGPPGERFLVLDSDTAIIGDVLTSISPIDTDFVVDKEEQTIEDTKRLYFDWERVKSVDPEAAPPQFVFNSGQWIGTAGVLKRADFVQWIDWDSAPPSLRHSELFMPGDQGVLNYVLNKAVRTNKASVATKDMMHWPGHGMSGFDVESLESAEHKPRVIHWAGLKRHKLRDMPGADILLYFEKIYYREIPFGAFKRLFRALQYWVSSLCRVGSTRVSQRLRAISGARRR